MYEAVLTLVHKKMQIILGRIIIRAYCYNAKKVPSPLEGENLMVMEFFYNS